MILNNYWAWKTFDDQYLIAYNADDSLIDVGIVATDGTSCPVCYKTVNNTNLNILVTNNTWIQGGITTCVGNGDTAVTPMDYELKNDITSVFTNYKSTYNFSSDTQCNIMTCTISGVNASGTTQIINEFGIMKKITTNLMTPKDVLLVRELLNTPITVPPQLGFSLTFQWISSGSGTTDNYNKWLAWKNTQVASDISVESFGVSLCNYNGDLFNPSHWNQSGWYNKDGSLRSFNYGLKLVLGTGTEPIRDDDYHLDADITSSISNYVQSFNWSHDDYSYTLTATGSGFNNTGTTITLSEVGIVKTVLHYNSSTEINEPILIARKLLDNPIVVMPGKGFSLTIEWVQS